MGGAASELRAGAGLSRPQRGGQGRAVSERAGGITLPAFEKLVADVGICGALTGPRLEGLFAFLDVDSSGAIDEAKLASDCGPLRMPWWSSAGRIWMRTYIARPRSAWSSSAHRALKPRVYLLVRVDLGRGWVAVYVFIASGLGRVLKVPSKIPIISEAALGRFHVSTPVPARRLFTVSSPH